MSTHDQPVVAPARKGGGRLRGVKHAGIALALVLGLTGGAAVDVHAATTTQTVAVAEDAYVVKTRASTNYGGSAIIQADASPTTRGYLRFDLRALTGAVTDATLRLYALSTSSIGLEARAVPSTTWSETAITYKNAPAPSQAILDASGGFASGTWVDFDVTAGASAGALVSFALTTASSAEIMVAAREYGSSFAPQLLVTTSDAPPANVSPPTITGAAQEGATLSAGQGTWSGAGPITYAYRWRRCDSSGLGCNDLPQATSPSYLLTSADVGSTVRVVVTASNAAGSTDATSAATQVVTAAPTAAPVIAAAGDIACDPGDSLFNGGLGTTTACRQRVTSDVLASMNLSAVLTLGDNQYECGGYNAFLQSYDPSWGRLKAITHPATGNHEYLASGGTNCDTAGTAAGYFRYFGASAGDPAKGYYSYDLGGWHFVALNSNCAQVGGCGAGSPQETWLRGDLAASSATCTLAYWHHPLFSSGAYRPGVTAARALFQALYDNRADVVLAGHDHNYERFAPQTPAGALDLTSGIRTFVVGTGGRELYSQGAPIANSEFRRANTFGVLLLTLHTASHEWRFVSDSGQTVDSGSDSCDGTAADSTPPTAPTGLVATPASSTRVDLTWAAASDNLGVIRYEIERNGTVIASTSSAVTSFVDATAAGASTYTYRVKARDAAGNVSAPSAGTTVTTPPGGGTGTTIVSDAFERTVSSGFGTADVGGAWSVSSTATTKVGSGEGVVYGWTGGNQDVRAWTATLAADMDVRARVRLNSTDPVGASYQPRVMARAQTDARNGYSARITHTTAGGLNWGLSRVDNAGGTGSLSLASGTLASSGAAGTRWWIRLQVQGTAIRARFWRDGAAEPTAWTAQATDGYWANGRAALGVFTSSGLSMPFPDTGFLSFDAVALG